MQEDYICQRVRFHLAMRGYTVTGGRFGWWIFSRWVIKLTRDDEVYIGRGRTQPIALYQLVKQLPEREKETNTEVIPPEINLM